MNCSDIINAFAEKKCAATCMVKIFYGVIYFFCIIRYCITCNTKIFYIHFA